MDGEESENVHVCWQEEDSVNAVEYESMCGGGEVGNVGCRDEDERFDKGEKYGSDHTDEMVRHDLTSEEDEERMEQHNSSERVKEERVPADTEIARDGEVLGLV